MARPLALLALVAALGFGAAAAVPPVEPGPSAMETRPAGPAKPFVVWPGAERPTRERIIRVDAAPRRGFHHPYLLVLPEIATAPLTLLVEPNNDGESDVPFDTHFYWALDLADYRYRTTGKSIGAAVLVPVFPRFSNRLGGSEIYTHALARNALTTREPSLVRIDRQMLAMIDDARSRLGGLGIPVARNVLLNGFSASANFALRWAMLHPKRTCAVAAGGVGGLPTLPVSLLSGQRFDYPLGTADWTRLSGGRFDLRAHRQVPQLVYLGESDTNDPTQFRDSYPERQRAAVAKTLGMVPQQRVPRVAEIFRQAGYRAVDWVVLPGVGHEVPPEMEEWIGRFFRRQIEAGRCDERSPAQPPISAS